AYAGEGRDANIEELALSAGISQRAATSLVTTLVEAGICERVSGDRVHPTVAADTLVERVASLRSRFEVLRREDARRLRAIVDYANESGCRSAALRRYFGDDDPTPCGRCDLCRVHGIAPPDRFAGRRDRDRRQRGRAGRGWQGARPARAAPPAQVSPEGGGPPFDGERRRRRRRRRRRHGHGDGATRPPMAGAVQSSAPPPLPLPPLDPA